MYFMGCVVSFIQYLEMSLIGIWGWSPELVWPLHSHPNNISAEHLPTLKKKNHFQSVHLATSPKPV